jgi:arylsulfatase A-like enzyme
MNRPNLVYIFPDQFRQQAIGCMGADPVVTPNLDRLASEGVVFTHAVSNFPVCSPYRAMLLTGQYPFRNGVYGNCYSKTAPLGIELSADACCFSDVLHEAGYNLGYIGKWHLDAPREEHIPYTEGWRGKPGRGTYWDTYTPPERRHGLDFWHAYGCCDWHLTPHYWEGDAAVDERIDVQGWSVAHETDVAVDYVTNVSGRYRDPERPFALFVAFNPPHTPFDQVPSEYLAQYADASPSELLNRPNFTAEGRGTEALRHVRNYFAAVTGIDQQIGRILAALDEQGLVKETIVVFTSDHGEMMGSHGLMHKNVWYDESLLVPFIIRWSGRIQPGRDDLLLSVPDLMPSLLSLMREGARIPSKVQGRDYANAFRGEPLDRPQSALYMLVDPEHPQIGNRGLRTHEHTYVVQREDGSERVLLFDNLSGPYQMENVADSRPATVQALGDELQACLERAGDPWVVGQTPEQSLTGCRLSRISTCTDGCLIV